MCVCVCLYTYSLSNAYYSKTVLSATIPFKNPRLRQPVVSTVIGQDLIKGAHLFHKSHSAVTAPLPVKTCGSLPPKKPSSDLVACRAKIALVTRYFGITTAVPSNVRYPGTALRCGAKALMAKDLRK